VLLSDKLTLFILLAQAPVIAINDILCDGAPSSRAILFRFVLAIVAVWFGTSVSAREIVRERPVFERERMVQRRPSALFSIETFRDRIHRKHSVFDVVHSAEAL
jgi:hypothetical protein